MVEEYLLGRSLQKPDPGEPFITEDRDVIPMIRRAPASADQGDRYRLRDLTAEIGSRWGIEDDGDRVTIEYSV